MSSDSVIEYLINVTTAPDFRPWELSDLSPRVKIDKAVANQSPQIGVLEKLHEAAYKKALSNSLYCPDYMVGRITATILASHYTSVRMALVGLGEMCVESGVGLAHALVACEAAVTGSAETSAFSVLQRVLGAGLHAKRGSNITSQLSQGIAKATAQLFNATAFRATYSDSGLFGVYVISQADAAGEVISAAVAKVTAEGKLTADELSRAKNQLLADYLMSLESSECFLEELGVQVLSSGADSSPESVTQSIDAVTSSDVVNGSHIVVKRVISGGIKCIF
ncbi:cytochrome b-c1 complex subunit 2, mitochondrial-like [Myxocyprinus asiaticus]|uniref:cytochrome b-c1 complex subunit 2, mitochondrial-like n=1 Tax=Myxocyprinus asiaticus TaxID=70543 RepID=UPI0022229ED5|nr:cytochrome b-c1 complex subunit 2, mitochondrial-like [Myxocyprinus asiaticus]